MKNERKLIKTLIGYIVMKKEKIVAMLNCHDDDVFCFRKEIIDDLLDKGYTVLISCPYGKRIESIRGENVIYENINIDRRGTNPIKDLILYNDYLKLFRKYKPFIVLAFTIKPNIYGGYAAKKLGIPYINNITGLGSGFEKDGIVKKIILTMYKIVLNSSEFIYFQNEANKEKILATGIIKHKRFKVIPGSGVNLKKFYFCTYPNSDKLVFNYIGRVMKDKNIDDYLYIAEKLKAQYNNLVFNVIGFIEETENQYKDKLSILEKKGIINYLGAQQDIRPYIEESCAIIHPSAYGEGLSNVLLETAATGRVLLTTTVPGCYEIVEEGVNGFHFEPNNRAMMLDVVNRFIQLPYIEKVKMGKASRKIAEENFSREIVVKEYTNRVNQFSNYSKKKIRRWEYKSKVSND